MLARRKDKSVKEIREAFIVDEVCADAQLLKSAVRVSNHSINDGSQTSDSDPVVADVKQVQGLVFLKGLAERASTVDIDDVAVEVQCLESRVGLERLAEILDSRDTHLALGEIEVHDALVVRERSVEKLAAFLVKRVLAKVERSDFAFADWVLTDCIGKEFHVLVCEVALTEAQELLALGHPVKEVWPHRVSLLDDVLGFEVVTKVREL